MSFGPVARALWSLPQLKSAVERLDALGLADLEANFAWYGISGGSILFREGDAADDAFMLLAGRLGVYVDAGQGIRLIAQIGPGELAGEMALISGEPRSATVVALRDSELVRIPRDGAERLINSNPQLMRYVLHLLAGRLKRSHRPPLSQATKAIAVVPVDEQPLEREVGSQLHKEFSSLSIRVGLIDHTGRELNAEAIARIEEDHDLVLYLGDRRCSPWSSRCLRQADRVVFLADAATQPDEEADRQIGEIQRLHRTGDLMLLNRADAVEPEGATRWLGRFPADRIFHVRKGNRADYARVARLSTGRGIGLVLSGGGARGLAHVGAMRALEQSGIPIDLVGGTSMGAVVGYCAARDLNAAETREKLSHTLVGNPSNDYTLPFVALTRGRKLTRLIRQYCGPSTIENLWKNFFCVSSNLSTGNTVVHQQGPVWQALRASSSLPGIAPPFLDQGQVLVDGGIMNNFPADVMSSFARGSVIGIEVMPEMSVFAKATDIEEKSLLWLLRNHRKLVPGIFDVLLRSATVSSEAQRALSHSKVDVLVQPQLEGIDVFSFASFDRAIELGYQATMEAIERLEVPLV
jgi:NTE family protein